MIREGSLEEISDGKLYGINDMVRADTNQCSGCKSVCCHGMGKTIILDPYDIYQLTTQLSVTFEQLLEGKIELNVVNGLILPNLSMQNSTNACAFLNAEKRCEIHKARPGICRLFPLGRYWEDEKTFHYILQTGQCNKDNLTKIKVKKWLDMPELEQYHRFVVLWHIFIVRLREALVDLNDDNRHVLTMYLIRTFYATPYAKDDFYGQFEARLSQAVTTLAMEEITYA